MHILDIFTANVAFPASEETKQGLTRSQTPQLENEAKAQKQFQSP